MLISGIRKWEYMTSVVLGLAAASAPWLFYPEPGLTGITLNAVVVGIAISVLATLELVVPPH